MTDQPVAPKKIVRRSKAQILADKQAAANQVEAKPKPVEAKPKPVEAKPKPVEANAAWPFPTGGKPIRKPPEPVVTKMPPTTKPPEPVTQMIEVAPGMNLEMIATAQPKTWLQKLKDLF